MSCDAVFFLSLCFTSTETIKVIRDGYILVYRVSIYRSLSGFSDKPVNHHAVLLSTVTYVLIIRPSFHVKSCYQLNLALSVSLYSKPNND